jgi:tetratricopeptide (TPR) repeat protein
VPASWQNCTLFVHGSPGTTFSIVETDDDETQKSEMMARYDAAVRANPSSAVAMMARARAYLTALKLDAAMADFSRAIELDPKLAAAYSDRANLYLVGGKYAEGLADAEAALKLDSKNDAAKKHRAFANGVLGNHSKALDDYEDMKTAKDNDGYAGRAVTYFAQGRYSNAEGDFRAMYEMRRGDLGIILLQHLSRLKRDLPADAVFAKYNPRLPKADWRWELIELFRGNQTLEQTEADMKAAQKNPPPAGLNQAVFNKLKQRGIFHVEDTLLRDNWPCQSRFYFGQYRLAHGDAAGARADFTQMITEHCYAAETVAAAAELKRLPAN